MTTVAQLLHDGRLAMVTADVAAAWERLDEARRHLQSSASLAGSDGSLAYVALYDAVRKAFDRMRRIRNRSEYGHQAIGTQALAADLLHARAIVAAVEVDLPSQPT